MPVAAALALVQLVEAGLTTVARVVGLGGAAGAEVATAATDETAAAAEETGAAAEVAAGAAAEEGAGVAPAALDEAGVEPEPEPDPLAPSQTLGPGIGYEVKLL